MRWYRRLGTAEKFLAWLLVLTFVPLGLVWLAATYPWVATWIGLSVVGAAAVGWFIYQWGKCPHCLTPLVAHREFSNAVVCPACKYIQINQ